MKIIDMIEDEWKDAFLKFVRTGENSEEFLAYLGRDKRAQEALEKVFEKQEMILADMAELIADSSKQP